MSTSSANSQVIIIGGGPAGMSAALVLGRSRINTIVLDSGQPRNVVTTHSHGFLTRDGTHPIEILDIAKEQLSKYKTVTYIKTKAVKLERSSSNFKVATTDGEYTSKRLILATGYQDNIAQTGITGLEQVYGKSVYPCPFCDGFELADKKLAVFGDATNAPVFAKTIAHWSNDVVVFTNGANVEDATLLNELKINGVKVVNKPIAQLNSVDGQLQEVILNDGSSIQREGGFISDTKATESLDFAKKLAIPTTTGHFGRHSYEVDENMETCVKGLYIIGDYKIGFSGVAKAVADGSITAAAITHQIIEEDWKTA